MAHKTRVHTILPLLVLIAFGLAMPGCETAQDPLGVETPPTSGWLAIEAGAEGASAWVLVTPDLAEVAGTGDSLIADPVEGEYWLLWEPVEEWKSPRDNPASVTLSKGSTETFEASYARIEGGMGDLLIEVGPDKIRPAWNVYGPDGFFAAGKGARKLPRREVGEYRIVWGDEPGYRTPPEAQGQLDPDQALAFNGVYEAQTELTGTIHIDADPDALNAPWELRDSTTGRWNGNGDATIGELPLGDYTIIWQAVDGFDTPGSSTASLGADVALTFRGTYAETQVPTGTIEVDANPDAIAAPWQLSSASGGSWSGNGDQLLADLALEGYTITWGDVDGYVTPAPVSGTLTATATLRLSGNYVEEQAPVGTVVINPDPDGISAPWSLVSDTEMVYSGSGDSTLTGLPVGDYMVAWGEVSGYVTPETPILALGEGASVEFAATYEPEAEPVGTIHIDPNPDSISAPWQLESDAGEVYTGAGDSTLVDLPMGVYTLTWGEVEGYETPSPNPVTQTLQAGGTAVFALE